jgi:hypothetical protein
MESATGFSSAPAKSGAVTGDNLAVSAIGNGLAGVTQLLELVLLDGSEAPLGGDSHLLASGEFELGATKGLDGGVFETEQGADGPAEGGVRNIGGRGCGDRDDACLHDDLANFNTGKQAVGLAESSTHTGLQTIGAGAGQHFVDAENVVRVDADAQVEVILAGHLRNKSVEEENATGIERKAGEFVA